MRSVVRSFGVAAVIAAAFAAGWAGHAQAPVAPVLPPPMPMFVSGNEIGFRIEGFKGSTPTGKFVIRVNGQWVDVAPSVGFHRLSTN